jgi:chromosome segregation ATPase
MRVVAERRPDLAERLERLRRRDPERFERVLMDAFMIRMERALAEAEADLGRHPGERTYERPGPPPEERRFERHVRELHERNEELERRSLELAERSRRLPHEEAEPEECRRVLDELTGAVNEHFEVRTELRRTELERVERELHRLRETIERMRRDFERRERERDTIIERRVRRLLGDEFGDW